MFCHRLALEISEVFSNLIDFVILWIRSRQRLGGSRTLWGVVFVGMDSACLELIQSWCGRCDGGVGAWEGWGPGWQWLEEGRSNGRAWQGWKDVQRLPVKSWGSCDSKGALDNPAKVRGGHFETWILAIGIEGNRRELAEVEGLGFDIQP